MMIRTTHRHEVISIIMLNAIFVSATSQHLSANWLSTGEDPSSPYDPFSDIPEYQKKRHKELQAEQVEEKLQNKADEQLNKLGSIKSSIDDLLFQDSATELHKKKENSTEERSQNFVYTKTRNTSYSGKTSAINSTFKVNRTLSRTIVKSIQGNSLQNESKNILSAITNMNTKDNSSRRNVDSTVQRNNKTLLKAIIDNKLDYGPRNQTEGLTNLNTPSNITTEEMNMTLREKEKNKTAEFQTALKKIKKESKSALGVMKSIQEHNRMLVKDMVQNNINNKNFPPSYEFGNNMINSGRSMRILSMKGLNPSRETNPYLIKPSDMASPTKEQKFKYQLSKQKMHYSGGKNINKFKSDQYDPTLTVFAEATVRSQINNDNSKKAGVTENHLLDGEDRVIDNSKKRQFRFKAMKKYLNTAAEYMDDKLRYYDEESKKMLNRIAPVNGKHQEISVPDESRTRKKAKISSNIYGQQHLITKTKKDTAGMPRDSFPVPSSESYVDENGDKNIDINVVLPKPKQTQKQESSTDFKEMLASILSSNQMEKQSNSKQDSGGSSDTKTLNNNNANNDQLNALSKLLSSTAFSRQLTSENLIGGFNGVNRGDSMLENLVGDLTRALDRQQMSQQTDHITHTLSDLMVNMLLLTGHPMEHIHHEGAINTGVGSSTIIGGNDINKIANIISQKLYESKEKDQEEDSKNATLLKQIVGVLKNKKEQINEGGTVTDDDEDDDDGDEEIVEEIVTPQRNRVSASVNVQPPIQQQTAVSLAQSVPVAQPQVIQKPIAQAVVKQQAIVQPQTEQQIVSIPPTASPVVIQSPRPIQAPIQVAAAPPPTILVSEKVQPQLAAAPIPVTASPVVVQAPPPVQVAAAPPPTILVSEKVQPKLAAAPIPVAASPVVVQAPPPVQVAAAPPPTILVSEKVQPQIAAAPIPETASPIDILTPPPLQAVIVTQAPVQVPAATIPAKIQMAATAPIPTVQEKIQSQVAEFPIIPAGKIPAATPTTIVQEKIATPIILTEKISQVQNGKVKQQPLPGKVIPEEQTILLPTKSNVNSQTVISEGDLPTMFVSIPITSLEITPKSTPLSIIRKRRKTTMMVRTRIITKPMRTTVIKWRTRPTQRIRTRTVTRFITVTERPNATRLRLTSRNPSRSPSKMNRPTRVQARRTTNIRSHKTTPLPTLEYTTMQPDYTPLVSTSEPRKTNKPPKKVQPNLVLNDPDMKKNKEKLLKEKQSDKNAESIDYKVNEKLNTKKEKPNEKVKQGQKDSSEKPEKENLDNTAEKTSDNLTTRKPSVLEKSKDDKRPREKKLDENTAELKDDSKKERTKFGDAQRTKSKNRETKSDKNVQSETNKMSQAESKSDESQHTNEVSAPNKEGSENYEKNENESKNSHKEEHKLQNSKKLTLKNGKNKKSPKNKNSGVFGEDLSGKIQFSRKGKNRESNKIKQSQVKSKWYTIKGSHNSKKGNVSPNQKTRQDIEKKKKVNSISIKSTAQENRIEKKELRKTLHWKDIEANMNLARSRSHRKMISVNHKLDGKLKLHENEYQKTKRIPKSKVTLKRTDRNGNNKFSQRISKNKHWKNIMKNVSNAKMGLHDHYTGKQYTLKRHQERGRELNDDSSIVDRIFEKLMKKIYKKKLHTNPKHSNR